MSRCGDVLVIPIQETPELRAEFSSGDEYADRPMVCELPRGHALEPWPGTCCQMTTRTTALYKHGPAGRPIVMSWRSPAWWQEYERRRKDGRER